MKNPWIKKINAKKGTSLGEALRRYTNKDSDSYDPKFDKQLRMLRPDWFEVKD